MTKHVALTYRQWYKIKGSIENEYPRSVWAIREKQKRVLGFTTRRHNPLTSKESMELSDREGYRAVVNEKRVMLDFYSEKKKTWFLMKYSEFLT